MVISVTDWLKELGLEQYAPAFRNNDIDGVVLPELTADDLTGLGVNSIGHRRKLLAAIAALRQDVAQLATARTGTEVGSLVSASAAAERRQLSVLFCDLVGSTSLAIRLDPEDLREIIAAYHHSVSDILTRHGGFVAKYMGDGVLAYFGYPEAHEDDAERAVRAGLAVAEGVARLPVPVRGLTCGLESRLASSWSAIFSARAPRKSRQWSARRRTWQPACRPSPSPTR